MSRRNGSTGPSRDVVFAFSYMTWDGARRRGMHFAEDRLAAGLIGHPRVRRVLVANAYRSAPVWAVRRLSMPPAERFPARGDAHLVQPVRLRRWDPVRMAAIDRAYRRYDRTLRRAAERHGLERPAVVTTHPFVAGFAPLAWAGSVTFYALNDMTAHPEYRAWWPAYEEAYARIGASGRAVCAVSEPILERIRPTGAAAVVPNGIDEAEWRHPGPPPSWLLELPGPRLLYLGTVDDRLDVEQLARLADDHPSGSLVLVGPLSPRARLDGLAERSNVHVRPAPDRSEVPGIVAAADACLIPHARTALTTAMSPLKLYEYLAAGRPVAATDLPGSRSVSPRVRLAPAGGDLRVAVREALELGPCPEPERLAFIRDHAWAGRHDAILDIALGAGGSDESATASRALAS